MSQNSTGKQAQIVYFGHGGGPLPILGDPGHKSMLDFLHNLPSMLVTPDSILVISAHWEESQPTLLGASKPPMFYDYYGFPEAAYQVTYPAPGNPQLAGRIAEIFQARGIPANIDPTRGFDHGLFIPLKMMYPQANIPSLQLSLRRGLDPAVHISFGNALRDLASENILVLGSGFSFHNMRAFAWGGDDAPDPANDAFQDWLIETCTGSLSLSEREERLIQWTKAPFARYCHPREEHLIPLHVCFGMANNPAKLIYDDKILGKRNVAFLW